MTDYPISKSLAYVYSRLGEWLDVRFKNEISGTVKLGSHVAGPSAINTPSLARCKPKRDKLVLTIPVEEDSLYSGPFAMYTEAAVRPDLASSSLGALGQATDLSKLIRLFDIEQRPLLVHDLINVLEYQSTLKFTEIESGLTPPDKLLPSMKKLCQEMASKIGCANWFDITNLSLKLCTDSNRSFYVSVDTVELSTCKEFSFLLKVHLETGPANRISEVQLRCRATHCQITAQCDKLTDLLLMLVGVYQTRKTAKELQQECEERGLTVIRSSLPENYIGELSGMRLTLVDFDFSVILGMESPIGDSPFRPNSENMVALMAEVPGSFEPLEDWTHFVDKDKIVSFVVNRLTKLYTY